MINKITKLAIVLIISALTAGYTFSTQGNYIGTISQIDLPAKNIRIVLLDLRGIIPDPFKSYIQENNITVQNFAIAALRISTNKILKFYTADTLNQIKQKTIDYAKTQNVNLKFKAQGLGKKVSDWWLKMETY